MKLYNVLDSQESREFYSNIIGETFKGENNSSFEINLYTEEYGEINISINNLEEIKADEKVIKVCKSIISSYDIDEDRERVYNQLFGFLNGYNEVVGLKDWYEIYEYYYKVIENLD